MSVSVTGTQLFVLVTLRVAIILMNFITQEH